MVTEVRLVQSENDSMPMEVTLLGKMTEVKLLQPENVLALILVIRSGIMMEFRLVQFTNAFFPISVKLLGSWMEVRAQRVNAYSSIEVTLEGMVVFLHPLINLFVAVSIRALQLFRES